MSISYDNLWVLLSKKGLNRSDLCKKAGITTNVIAKMSKNESVQVEVLSKICGALECSFDDIISNTGENSIIAPLPKIDFDNYVFWGVREEFDTLGLKSIKDLPKPHSINNIKKYLIRSIKECKLSFKAVDLFITELRKYNISISIGENVKPDYDKLPKDFSTDYNFRMSHNLEYQQCKNYLDWFFKEKSIAERLGFTEHTNFDVYDLVERNDKSEPIKILALKENQIDYIGEIESVDNNSEYPFTLFSVYSGRQAFYCKSQKLDIENTIRKMLAKLTDDERAIIKYVFEENKSIDDLYDTLQISDNKLLEDAFYEFYYQEMLKRLRFPSIARYIRPLVFYTDIMSINPNDLTWRQIDVVGSTEFIKSISETIKFDYALSLYISSRTHLNTRFIIIEVFHQNDLYWNMFSWDAIGNMIKVDNSIELNNIIKSIVSKLNEDFLSPSKARNREISIEEWDDLSVRSFNCLKRASINTLDDIISKTEDDLMRVKNLGKKSLEEVLRKVKEYGYYLNAEGFFEHKGLGDLEHLSIMSFAKYYSALYARNDIKTEELLKKDFIDRCNLLGFSLNSADWFMDMINDTDYSLNDIFLIDKIKNAKLLGSIILRKWRHITHWTCGSLLSKETRIWFIIAFNRLYQIGLEETEA